MALLAYGGRASEDPTYLLEAKTAPLNVPRPWSLANLFPKGALKGHLGFDPPQGDTGGASGSGGGIFVV